ncbi:beta-propeller fold lactonase family protein, partial [Algimonas arctica]|uniref:beta-propeller fold lactonase family protein n=1 Tax=Algimonas arctica TaxID=1479486 RepID=UPI00167B20F9
MPGASGATYIEFTQDGSIAYVTDYLGGAVTVLDAVTNSIIAFIDVGTQTGIVEFTPDDNFAYVTNQGSNNVSVIDIATHTVVDTITVGTSPFGLDITPDGSFAYVTNQGSRFVRGSVSVIDIATNVVVADVTVGLFPRHVTITPDGSLALVANIKSTFISVIDTATNTVISTIQMGGTSRDIAITPDGNFAYVMSLSGNKITVIDLSTNTITATIPMVNDPVSLLFTPDGRFGYVNNIFDKTVTVIDTTTNTVVGGTITVGERPRDIEFRPEAANEKPIAAAGVDQAIRAGDTVNLDGSASFDDNTDSAALAYSWSFASQPTGSTATITDAMTATPSFVADLAGAYDVSLVVTDEGGLNSDADSVSVSSDNLALTAIAGEGQLVILGSNVYLDGSGSNDPEMDPLSFA